MGQNQIEMAVPFYSGSNYVYLQFLLNNWSQMNMMVYVQTKVYNNIYIQIYWEKLGPIIKLYIFIGYIGAPEYISDSVLHRTETEK